ncbi:CubicO group peptidase (beta-lactamase class C family) [Saonia flava]|uniref:CubicO group peptidase (Beta-lactamase class C family) n=1 Tax=Saonia flava TaxID=523696 RepID=A0A846QWS1_9FLAO|nr:serine hydrolase domain-containing protein [Saonia flava]NJB72791.1 CubicO group peptidase (beta-lactamase class C family) [Saonia flava]
MKVFLFSKPFVIVATILFFQFCHTANSQFLESKIDSLLESKYRSTAPGAAFLVAKNGIPIYRKAFGKANLELNVPMRPENVFEIGSMTKQFTAIAILVLVEKGMLDLDDEILKFIPDYPSHGKKITIHHLLTHTSGIKNFTNMKALRDISKKDLTPLELIDFFKNEPMDFNPGEKFKYTNSGYFILGYIIESVSGITYKDYIEKNIFQKIGMESSLYASHSKVIKNRASGYHYRDDYINKMYISLTLPYASGSIMSTVDDLLKWQEALNQNVLVSQNTINKAYTNYTLNDGEYIDYGYGWHLKKINGVLSMEHGGSIFGFKSMGVYIPSEDVYVIGLSNCDCNSPTKITKEIAALVINEIYLNNGNKN